MRSRAIPLTVLATAMLALIAGGCGDRNDARVAPSPTAQATPAPTRNAGSENPLDLGTASVLAYDLGLVYANDAAPELHKCVRMTVARVDCEIYYRYEGVYDVPDKFAIKRRGERFVGARYQYFDVPKDDKLVGLNRLYTKEDTEWYPAELVREHVGLGRPKLKGLLRKQCALQPCGKHSGRYP